VAQKPRKILEVANLSFAYGAQVALRNICFSAHAQTVVALVGPSGCGKTTLLRCINRMNDVYPETRIVEGAIFLDGNDIYDSNLDPTELRRNVGMVFQKSSPFPKTIYENIAYGPRIQGLRDKAELDAVIERSLRSVDLWNEVKDRLNRSAYELPPGQQQRLCIARALAVRPQVLLMDEPCSAMDPINTAKVEELIHELKKDCTVIIATHNMQQAARMSDYTGFLNAGQLIEFNQTDNFFMNPQEAETEAYISGRFG